MSRRLLQQLGMTWAVLALCMASPLWVALADDDGTQTEITDPNYAKGDQIDGPDQNSITPLQEHYQEIPGSQSTPNQVYPTQNKPWYKKLFAPQQKGRHGSRLPIDQVKKVDLGPPRETTPLPDPLIRLSRSLSYQGTQVSPGFYIIKPSGGNSLSLYRQEQAILTVPASVKSVTTAPAQPLPTPPQHAMSKGQKAAAGAKAPVASGHVELGDSGKTIVLIYQRGGQKYTSVPIPVGNDY